MTAADGARQRWLDGGGSDYRVLPEQVPLEDTIATHPTEPAEPPSGWSAGPADLDGDDGD